MLVFLIGIEICEVGVCVSLPVEMGVEVFISLLQDEIIFIEGLNGFHRIKLVQFVDMVRDAGVEGSC